MLPIATAADSSVLVAMIGGVAMLANSTLTIWLTAKLARKHRKRRNGEDDE